MRSMQVRSAANCAHSHRPSPGPTHANGRRHIRQVELNQLTKLRTWDIVNRPCNKPVIPCSYIFKIKLGPTGEVLKYKARVVAGSHRQKKGINYDETFAAMAKIASIRVLLALAAQRDWGIDQIDVVSAYLNTDLQDEVYSIWRLRMAYLMKGRRGRFVNCERDCMA